MAVLKAGNVVQAKTGTLTFANTTAKTLFTLPAGAMVVGGYIYGALSSGGATGAITIGVGATRQNVAVADSFVASLNVHATFDPDVVMNTSGAWPFNRLPYPMPVTATFTGDDTAGSWSIVLYYL